MPKMKARRCYWQNLLFTGRTGLWQYRKAPVHGNVYPRDYEDVSGISKVTYGSDLQLPIRTSFWLQKLVTSYSNSHFVITLAHVTDILQGERISECIVFLRYLTLILKYLDSHFYWFLNLRFCLEIWQDQIKCSYFANFVVIFQDRPDMCSWNGSERIENSWGHADCSTYLYLAS